MLITTLIISKLPSSNCRVTNLPMYLLVRCTSAMSSESWFMASQRVSKMAEHAVYGWIIPYVAPLTSTYPARPARKEPSPPARRPAGQATVPHQRPTVACHCVPLLPSIYITPRVSPSRHAPPLPSTSALRWSSLLSIQFLITLSPLTSLSSHPFSLLLGSKQGPSMEHQQLFDSSYVDTAFFVASGTPRRAPRSRL
jgi:hypothetical protein